MFCGLVVEEFEEVLDDWRQVGGVGEECLEELVDEGLQGALVDEEALQGAGLLRWGVVGGGVGEEKGGGGCCAGVGC